MCTYLSGCTTKYGINSSSATKRFSILRITSNKVDFKKSQYVSEIMQSFTTQNRKMINNWYRSKYSQHQNS